MSFGAGRTDFGSINHASLKHASEMPVRTLRWNDMLTAHVRARAVIMVMQDGYTFAHSVTPTKSFKQIGKALFQQKCAPLQQQLLCQPQQHCSCPMTLCRVSKVRLMLRVAKLFRVMARTRSLSLRTAGSVASDSGTSSSACSIPPLKA